MPGMNFCASATSRNVVVNALTLAANRSCSTKRVSTLLLSGNGPKVGQTHVQRGSVHASHAVSDVDIEERRRGRRIGLGLERPSDQVAVAAGLAERGDSSALRPLLVRT